MTVTQGAGGGRLGEERPDRKVIATGEEESRQKKGMYQGIKKKMEGTQITRPINI